MNDCPAMDGSGCDPVHTSAPETVMGPGDVGSKVIPPSEGLALLSSEMLSRISSGLDQESPAWCGST